MSISRKDRLLEATRKTVITTGTITGLLFSSGAFAGFCLDAPVNGEVYKLANEGSGLSLEVVSKSTDDNVPYMQFFGRSKLNNQKFTVTDLGNDQWKIEALHSGKALSSADTLLQMTSAEDDNQAWTLQPALTGGYHLVSVGSGKMIAAESDLSSAAVSLVSANATPSDLQTWYFNPVNATCSSVAIRVDGGAADSKVMLTWEKPVGEVQQLEIFYDTDSHAEGRTRIASIDPTARSYTATGLENGTDYWFWVRYMVDGVWYNSNAFHSAPDAKYPLLSQISNPIKTELETYKDEFLTGTLAADKTLADNVISWQLDNGGFYKHKLSVYSNPWDGESAKSKWHGKVINADGTETKIPIGTIDNDATVRELMFLADVYQRSGEEKYRTATRKAFDFLIEMQFSKGGFPQVYPARSGTLYSNYVTYNDNAMVRVMYMLDKAREANWPFNGDVLTNEQRSAAKKATKKGIKYTRRAQIFTNGERTLWCGQHDPENYDPLGARSYELPGRDAKASALIIAYLMTQPQTADIKEVVESGLAFYRKPDTYKTDTKYIKRSKSSTDDTYNPFQPKTGTTTWYRFYELDSDIPFFSGRLPTDKIPGNGKQYDIMDVEPERRYGYEWGGSYGTKLLRLANNVGYTAE